MRMLELFSRPMGKPALVACLMGLGAFALASCFNSAIALSLLVTYAAVIVKIWKLQTEPFFLLTIHCLTSSLMLLDAPTTLALVVAVAAAIMAFGSCEVATDRVAVFLISITFATMLGNIPAILASVVMAVGLAFLKLRPLKLPGICLLVLHVLGVIVLVDRHLAAFVALAVTLAITVASVAGKLTGSCNPIGIMGEYNDNGNHNNIINHNNNNVNDRNISTPSHMHNGCLQLSNPTDSLDLQGHTVTSALQALHQFLVSHEEVYKKNRTGHTRHVKVITGEGGFHASQEMVNLIKPTVANFLKINKYRFDVNRENPGILVVDLESHAL